MARVVVDVMLKPEILDPQGQAIANALPRLGITDVSTVRIGRRIEIEFTGQPDLDKVRDIADKLLANPVIEDFTLNLDLTAADQTTVQQTAADQTVADQTAVQQTAADRTAPETAKDKQ